MGVIIMMCVLHEQSACWWCLHSMGLLTMQHPLACSNFKRRCYFFASRHMLPQLRILQLCKPLNFRHKLVVKLLELQPGRQEADAAAAEEAFQTYTAT
jgi:hypothetical protein